MKSLVCMLLIFSFSCYNINASVHHEYFWRDYYGVIPHDAVSGCEVCNVYIGQAFVPGQGLFTFPLYANSTEFAVPAYGYRTADKLIKILCSNDKSKFEWFKTSAKTFQVDTIGKNLVIGGYHRDEERPMLYVGRYFEQTRDTHWFGFVKPFLTDAHFGYIKDKGYQQDKSEFEVLTFVPGRGSYVPTAERLCNVTDYYWREYDGEIPEDAMPTGRDVTGKPTYMGQAFVTNGGTFVSQIYAGNRKVDFSCYGYRFADYNIKILCSNRQGAFYWKRTTTATYKSDTKDLRPVVGGWDEFGPGHLHIGRIFYQGRVIVGAVTDFKSPDLWFAFKNQHYATNVYEALIHRTCPKP